MRKFLFTIVAFLFATAAFAQQPQSSTAPDFAVSARYVQGGSAGGYRPTAGAGLTLNIGGGTSWCGGVVDTYTASTLTMANNATNRVYLNTGASCVPAVKSTAFVAADIPIAIVTTVSGGIVSIQDERTMFLTSGASCVSPCNIRGFGTTFGDTGGSALSSGSIVYFTVPYACTIAAWNISVDAGTATLDIWKIASGTAVPTIANTITASALPAIASGTSIHSTTLTAWTTAVAANDIFGIYLQTVATAKFVELDLQCNQ